MNIVFLGSGAFGIPSLEALARSPHRLLHVITQPDRPAGRGKLLTPTPVAAWALAHEHGTGVLPVTRTPNVNDAPTLQLLRDLQPDCLVVIAFGQKLSPELLRLAPRGGINLHSSLLPKYRGAAPINWAVINNDPLAGVSVIDVTAVMDAGELLAAAATPLGPSETAGELHDRLALLGAPLLPQVLDQLAAGTVTRVPQNPALATRAPKLSRDLAWVDFTQPAALVSARIRGLSPWPGVQVALLDPAGKPRVQATLLKCQATDSTLTHSPAECGAVLGDRSIACGLGSVRLLSLQPAGKKAMELGAFANGYGLAPGARFQGLVPVPTNYC